MNTNQEIISKIQKLMNTAADEAATPHEADVAMRLAQRLMHTHRITDADIERASVDAAHKLGEIRAEDIVVDVLGPRQRRQDGWLAQAVGQVCGVGVYQAHNSPKAVTAYGLPADIAVARELFLAIREEAMRACRAWTKPRGFTAASTQGKSFLDGFAIKLLERAKATKQKMLESTAEVRVENSTGTLALMVVERSLVKAVDDALAKKRAQIGIVRMRASRVNRDESAFVAGGFAQNSVSLNRNSIR